MTNRGASWKGNGWYDINYCIVKIIFINLKYIFPDYTKEHRELSKEHITFQWTRLFFPRKTSHTFNRSWYLLSHLRVRTAINVCNDLFNCCFKIQIYTSQLASSGQKIYLKITIQVFLLEINTVSMTKKLFSATERCDSECQKSEPIVCFILSYHRLSLFKSFFCVIFPTV